jgi:hypothetical protein
MWCLNGTAWLHGPWSDVTSAVAVVRLLLLWLQDAQRLFSFELDEIDMLDIDAAYEGAHQPTTDVYAWERGGSW